MNPAQSAELTKHLFFENKLKNILIIGIGYGRNAQPFLESGINLSEIEIYECT